MKVDCYGASSLACPLTRRDGSVLLNGWIAWKSSRFETFGRAASFAIIVKRCDIVCPAKWVGISFPTAQRAERATADARLK
jgi:hypothetical protein